MGSPNRPTLPAWKWPMRRLEAHRWASVSMPYPNWQHAIDPGETANAAVWNMAPVGYVLGGDLPGGRPQVLTGAGRDFGYVAPQHILTTRSDQV
jgi:hypothetical protein